MVVLVVVVSGSYDYAYNVRSQGNSGAVSYTAGSSGTEITLGIDNSTNRLYAKLDGTLNTTLNNAWANSTHGSVIDGNFYIIANSSGEGNNLDLDFIKTEILNDSGQAANAVLASTFQSGELQLLLLVTQSDMYGTLEK